MDALKPRHWFRFSLRTMFVLVTAGCIAFGWIGWHLQLRRERSDVLIGMMRSTTKEFFLLEGQPTLFPRSLFGYGGIKLFVLQRGVNDPFVTRLRFLFPEAELCLVNDIDDVDELSRVMHGRLQQ